MRRLPRAERLSPHAELPARTLFDVARALLEPRQELAYQSLDVDASAFAETFIAATTEPVAPD